MDRELLDQLRRVRSSPEYQAELCRPEVNADAAAFFVTSYCVTVDEERGGAMRPIEAKSFVLDFVRALEDARTDPANLHVEKSRRMLATWILCAYGLWCLSYLRGFTGLMISKSDEFVDDGGSNSTPNSMFGRMRFMHDRLPAHVRRTVDFATMRATCADTDSYMVGDAPKITAGRGGGYGRVFGDEHAYWQYADQIHEALDPACKLGKVYMCTVHGDENLFARLKEERPEGWRFHEIDWKDDPEKTVGMRPTEPGPERDRFGEYVSDWFRGVTSSLTPEQIAQEYNRNYQKSTIGVIFREYSKERHVAKAPIPYDDNLELWVGLDFGHARKTAASVGQPEGRRRLRVIGAWEGIHKSAPENAKDLVKYLREVVGYGGPLSAVTLVPDPSAWNEEIGTGLSLMSWYRAEGFTTYTAPLITGPDSVYRGNNVCRALFFRDMVTISPTAGPLIKALPRYKLPVDAATGQIKSNKPVHDMNSHPCDSFRYLSTALWTSDDFEGVYEPPPAPVRVGRPEEHELRDAVPSVLAETAPAPWGAPMLPWEAGAAGAPDEMFNDTAGLTSGLEGRRF